MTACLRSTCPPATDGHLSNHLSVCVLCKHESNYCGKLSNNWNFPLTLHTLVSHSYFVWICEMRTVYFCCFARLPLSIKLCVCIFIFIFITVFVYFCHLSTSTAYTKCDCSYFLHLSRESKHTYRLG